MACVLGQLLGCLTLQGWSAWVGVTPSEVGISRYVFTGLLCSLLVQLGHKFSIWSGPQTGTA
jgi:hypothetical protein